MAGTRLKLPEREFFVAIDRVIYANPFSDAQAQIIQRLVRSTVSAERRIEQDALWPMVEPRPRDDIDVEAITRLNTEGRPHAIVVVAAAKPVCVLGFGIGEIRTAPKTTLDAYAQNHRRQRP